MATRPAQRRVLAGANVRNQDGGLLSTPIADWSADKPEGVHDGTVTTIGLDLAKSLFQVDCADADDAAVLRRRLTRARLLRLPAKLPLCPMGMEGVRVVVSSRERTLSR
jgi:hypothetical protein